MNEAGREPESAQHPVGEGGGESQGALTRALGLLTDPVKTFEGLRGRPRFLGVLLLTLLIVAAATWLTQPIQQREQLELFKQSKFYQRMSPEQQQQMLASQQRGGVAGRVMAVGGALFAVVLFSYLLNTVICFVGTKILGGHGSFKDTLTVVVHGQFIWVGVGWLLRTPLVLAKDSFFSVSLGPAAFMDASFQDPVYRAAMLFDVVALWGAIVTGLGLAVLCRVGRASGIVVALVPLLLMLGVSYLFMSFLV